MVSTNYAGYGAVSGYGYPPPQGGPYGGAPSSSDLSGSNADFQNTIDQMTGSASSTYRDTMTMLDQGGGQQSSASGSGDSGSGGGGFFSRITKPFTDVVDGIGGAINHVIDGVFSIF